MPDRPYHMLPMNALISFEAAARHVSFKTAARELNVTPAAVSHQIKALEQDLNRALFERHHRGVSLTETGAYLLIALQRGLEGIHEAMEQLRVQASQSAVTIRATTAVSSLWLTPRLSQFWRRYGHISVSQIVSDTDQYLPDCDISIHYGDSTQEDGPYHPLFKDTIMALCSPDFAAQHRIESIEDFAQIPLIHLDAPDSCWIDWSEWLKHLGYCGPLKMAHGVNNYIIALQAAQDGIGAVLGWENLTHDYLKNQRLVQLCPQTLTSAQDFYVKLHNQSSNKAALVFNWLTTSA
ncbi:MAG: LysR substrate-binding domain-containing protein [Cohaesibacter sp.]|nr:LysR substrate-binding domain-containing protein [Cohaesibacter sp.]MCV6600537.1 LysR substrate-binding domain-containing protein [Cohaesibacter sp.]